MIYLSANKAVVDIARPIGPTDTTLYLTGDDLWPPVVLNSGNALQVTLMDKATGELTEIVQVTEHVSPGIVQVKRAQEGTTAKAYLVGDYAALIPTNAVNENIIQPGRGVKWYAWNDPALTEWFQFGPNIVSGTGELRVCVDYIRRTVRILGIVRYGTPAGGNGTRLGTITAKRFDGVVSAWAPYTPFLGSYNISGGLVPGYTEIVTVNPGATGNILFSGYPSTFGWAMLDLTIVYF